MKIVKVDKLCPKCQRQLDDENCSFCCSKAPPLFHVEHEITQLGKAQNIAILVNGHSIGSVLTWDEHGEKIFRAQYTDVRGQIISRFFDDGLQAAEDWLCAKTL